MQTGTQTYSCVRLTVMLIDDQCTVDVAAALIRIVIWMISVSYGVTTV